MKRYTALVNRNFRQFDPVHRMYLLTELKCLDDNFEQDHVWCRDKRILKYIPETNQKKVMIEFRANRVKYTNAKGDTKYKLSRVRDVKYVTEFV